MVTRDVEIPGGGVIFSPEILFVWDANTWNVQLVVRCAVKGTNLANRGLCNWGWFNRVADLVQCIQRNSGSDECGDSNESVQDCDN